LGERRGKNDVMSTNIWKEKVRNTEKETGEKDRRKKISREIST